MMINLMVYSQSQITDLRAKIIRKINIEINLAIKNNTLFDYFISNIYSFICMGAFGIITLLFLGILFKKKREKTSNC